MVTLKEITEELTNLIEDASNSRYNLNNYQNIETKLSYIDDILNMYPELTATALSLALTYKENQRIIKTILMHLNIDEREKMAFDYLTKTAEADYDVITSFVDAGIDTAKIEIKNYCEEREKNSLPQEKWAISYIMSMHSSKLNDLSVMQKDYCEYIRYSNDIDENVLRWFKNAGVKIKYCEDNFAISEYGKNKYISIRGMKTLHAFLYGDSGIDTIYGTSILHNIVKYNSNLPSCKLYPLLRTAVDLGANMDCSDKCNKYPLDYICGILNMDLVFVFHSLGYKLDKKNSVGKTFLNYMFEQCTDLPADFDNFLLDLKDLGFSCSNITTNNKETIIDAYLNYMSTINYNGNKNNIPLNIDYIVTFHKMGAPYDAKKILNHAYTYNEQIVGSPANKCALAHKYLEDADPALFYTETILNNKLLHPSVLIAHQTMTLHPNKNMGIHTLKNIKNNMLLLCDRYIKDAVHSRNDCFLDDCDKIIVDCDNLINEME